MHILKKLHKRYCTWWKKFEKTFLWKGFAGDCAILISSGMSPWRALFCNLLSSLPCFVGFVIGVLVGNTSTYFGQYIFALAAGMFLYISLVGMVGSPSNFPPLNRVHFRQAHAFCLLLSRMFPLHLTVSVRRTFYSKADVFFKSCLVQDNALSSLSETKEYLA